MKKHSILFYIAYVCLLINLLGGCVLSPLTEEQPLGDSVFEEIQKDGYKGTQDDLLDALKSETERDSNIWLNQDSAYDLAVENGYRGSKGDWLDTIVGSKEYETEYSDGKSVYELAVMNGFKGTLTEWLANIKEPLTKTTTTTQAETTSEKTTKPETQEVFTVTFKNFNGELIKIEKVKKGESATPPPTPTREGYTFVGWDRTFNKIEFDTIVNAQFKKIKEPTIIVERIDSSAGKKDVAVTVAVMNNPGISSLGLNVSYSQYLTLKDVKYNKDIKGEAMKPGNFESATKLTWLSPFEDVDGDWIIATLYFDVSEEAVGDLPISVTYNANNIYNMEEENIPFDVIDGAIAIIE